MSMFGFGNLFHKKPDESKKWLLLAALVLIFVFNLKLQGYTEGLEGAVRYSAPQQTTNTNSAASKVVLSQINSVKNMAKLVATLYGLYLNFDSETASAPHLAGNSLTTTAKTAAALADVIAKNNAEVTKAQKNTDGSYVLAASDEYGHVNIVSDDPLMLGVTETGPLIYGENVWKNLTVDSAYLTNEALPALQEQVQKIYTLSNDPLFQTQVARVVLDIHNVLRALNWYYDQMTTNGWLPGGAEEYPVLTSFLADMQSVGTPVPGEEVPESETQSLDYTILSTNTITALQSEANELITALKATRTASKSSGYVQRKALTDSMIKLLGDLRVVLGQVRNTTVPAVVDTIVTGMAQIIYPTMMTITPHIHGGAGINFMKLSATSITTIDPLTKVEPAPTDAVKVDMAKLGSPEVALALRSVKSSDEIMKILFDYEVVTINGQVGFRDFFDLLMILKPNYAKTDPEGGSTKKTNLANSYEEFMVLLQKIQTDIYEVIGPDITRLAPVYDTLSEVPMVAIPTIVTPKQAKGTEAQVTLPTGSTLRAIQDRVQSQTEVQTAQYMAQMHAAMGRVLFNSQQMLKTANKEFATLPYQSNESYIKAAAILSYLNVQLMTLTQDTYKTYYSNYYDFVMQMSTILKEGTLYYVSDVLAKAFVTGSTAIMDGVCDTYDCESITIVLEPPSSQTE